MDRATIQRITLIFGVVYLIVGVGGFIPGLTVADPNGQGAGAGQELGIFGINFLHNIAHLLFGAVLIYGGTSAANVGTVNKVMAAIFAVLVVAYFIEPLRALVNDDFEDTLLHLFSALLTGFLGFAADRSGRVAPTSGART